MPFPIKGVFHEIHPWISYQGINIDGRRVKCADFEINAVECLEAYGMIKGSSQCRKYIEDLMECQSNVLSNYRIKSMFIEKMKQIGKGERSWADRHGPKYPANGYIDGHFVP